MRTRICSAVIAGVALVASAPAASLAQYAGETGSLEASTSSVDPGGKVRVTGDGFKAGSPIKVTIESTPRTLATVTADSSGAFATTVTIPSDLSEGSHTLKASGVTPDGATRVLSTAITVGDAGGSLSTTGSPVFPLALAGVALVVIGGTFGFARRRRAVRA